MAFASRYKFVIIFGKWILWYLLFIWGTFLKNNSEQSPPWKRLREDECMKMSVMVSKVLNVKHHVLTLTLYFSCRELEVWRQLCFLDPFANRCMIHPRDKVNTSILHIIKCFQARKLLLRNGQVHMKCGCCRGAAYWLCLQEWKVLSYSYYGVWLFKL